MSKAYDGVEWGILVDIMKALGFHLRWIALIKKCISFVSYSIVVNGNVIETFSPERGL